MSDILTKNKLKWQTWAGILLLLAFSAAFSLTVRVFSLYTLLHWQKVLVFGYLFITLSLFLINIRQPKLAFLNDHGKKVIKFVVGVLGSMVFILCYVGYHKAPIRTVHELEITNISEDQDITLDYIQLPGDVRVDLLNKFPEYDFFGESVILHPGQSLVYTREMVGGVEISLSRERIPDSGWVRAKINWDGEEQQPFVYSRGGEVFSIVFPGWLWGTPSIIYLILGSLSIATDFLAAFGIGYYMRMMVHTYEVSIDSFPDSSLFTAIKTFYVPILINLGFMVLAVINQLWITKNITYSLALMLAGVASFIPAFFAQHRKWVLRAALPLILMGVLFNFYVFFSPINELHLTPEILTDDSLAKLAQKAGDSTYLSMGYYRYFRNTTLHIPADLMAELNLFTDRLERMNTGLQVMDAPYDYELAVDVADQWLEDYAWQAWPREVGGTYYLSLDETSPGDELYFFQSGDRTFLVSIDFLLESGMTDVSIFN